MIAGRLVTNHSGPLPNPRSPVGSGRVIELPVWRYRAVFGRFGYEEHLLPDVGFVAFPSLLVSSHPDFRQQSKGAAP